MSATSPAPAPSRFDPAAIYSAGRKYVKETADEIVYECVPRESLFSAAGMHNASVFVKDIFHVPYSPAFTKPGWLINLIMSPKDEKFYEGVYGDIFAGFTVGMTAIPQALSYAALAGLPPINGLYAMIFPSIFYIFLGSGMQLAVGPVALVSLLMGELVTKYGLDVTTDPTAVVNFAAECAFCSGLIMFVMGIFNLGNLIRFISYPVMAGFTTASAMIIGMNQIKNAFGFDKSANVPQVGGEVHYNYEVMKWYMENWDGRTSDGYLWRNVHATNITFGIYVPLFLLWLFKSNYKFTDKQKKTVAYQVFNFIATVATLLSLIIAGHEAYLIHNFNDTYHARALKVVGDVPPGLHIFRIPTFDFPLGKVLVDVIPLTIISYMESYSVARKTSAARGQLSILNASQELVAMGLGNMCNAVCSGYTVSGSFSRSSLYAACGAATPLAKSVTLVIILVALGTLTNAFYFIPQAALAAVVMVAICGLIDFHEFWVAWKLSKKDFFVMFTTFIFTFVFDTEIGLIVGVSISLVMLLKDLAFSLESKPISKAVNYNGVEIIRLNSNLVFVSAATIKDTLINEIFEKQKQALKAVVIDFIDVKHADLSGLFALKEVLEHAKKQKLAVVLCNVIPEVQGLLDRADVLADDITKCTPELQEAIRAAQAVTDTAAVASLDVESLGMVQDLLRVSKSGSLLELAAWSAAKESRDKGIEMGDVTTSVHGETYSMIPADDHEHELDRDEDLAI